MEEKDGVEARYVWRSRGSSRALIETFPGAFTFSKGEEDGEGGGLDRKGKGT